MLTFQTRSCSFQNNVSVKKRILCIDDSNTALMLLEYALNDAGYEAMLALSVKEAMIAIEAKIPDLILLDLSMPDISGYEFLEMKEKLKIDMVPVIVVSAFDSAESVSKIMNLGAVDFVSKPIRMDTILQKIKAALS